MVIWACAPDTNAAKPASRKRFRKRVLVFMLVIKPLSAALSRSKFLLLRFGDDGRFDPLLRHFVVIWKGSISFGGSTGGILTAKLEAMMRGLIVTALVCCALASDVVRLPASVCAVSSAPMGKACQPGCCANKKCCADSQANRSLPSQPLAKTGSANPDSLAVPATSLTLAISPVRSFELFPRSKTVYRVSAAPQPAFLCTFLI